MRRGRVLSCLEVCARIVGRLRYINWHWQITRHYLYSCFFGLHPDNVFLDITGRFYCPCVAYKHTLSSNQAGPGKLLAEW